MSDLRTAAQQALEALVQIHPGNMTPMAEEEWNKAIVMLGDALAEQPAEQEPGNWIVYNSGAEVASGLSLAEALEYLTPERLARQWCAVCVVDQSNLPKTPQPAKPAEQEPVAWIDITDEGQIVSSPRMYSDGSREERPLYTSPQPRRRLTDGEICAALDIDGSDDWTFTVAYAIIDAYERKNGVQT